MNHCNITKSLVHHRNLILKYVSALQFKVEHPIPDFLGNLWILEAPKEEVQETIYLWILDLEKSLPLQNRRESTLIRIFLMNMFLAIVLSFIYNFDYVQYHYMPLMSLSNAAITIYIMLQIFRRPYALSREETLHGIHILQEQLEILEKRE